MRDTHMMVHSFRLIASMQFMVEPEAVALVPASEQHLGADDCHDRREQIACAREH